MTHTSSKTGIIYHLHRMQVKVPGGGQGGELFYFAKKESEDKSKVCDAIPDDRVIVESANGFPIVRRK